ncbi:hypothetical protein [Helicobacter sp. 11S02629-2]|uniref:hypothetical protein n=1 Tax=Helicobacter sp. 11S02629-2 TaxID=1476195 RepID=UPI000BA6DAF4|nr:hypothetical protein [Helicobacter sp. 11S02629-2]PAF44175.1 hypothetical protein BKH40_06150 [Helicobacter sp. 11S02629-2]
MKHINILSPLIKKLIKEALTLEGGHFFYESSNKQASIFETISSTSLSPVSTASPASSLLAQDIKYFAIASTFDIAIANEGKEAIPHLLSEPILKKTKLGTIEGLNLALTPIFGKLNIQTPADTQKSLKPLEDFHFRVSLAPNIIDSKTLIKARLAIDSLKPLRDRLENIFIVLEPVSFSFYESTPVVFSTRYVLEIKEVAETEVRSENGI